MSDTEETRGEYGFYVLSCDSCEFKVKTLNYAMYECPQCGNTNVRITSSDSDSQEFYNETEII